MSGKTKDYILGVGGVPSSDDNVQKWTLQHHLQEGSNDNDIQQAPKGSRVAVMEKKDDAPTPVKGTQAWQEQNSGEEPVEAGSSSDVTERASFPAGGGSYEDMQKKLEEAAEARRKEEEKMQRRNKNIAAIGDALSALSNLYFTTQYAPDTKVGYNPTSEKMQARYDMLNDKRDAEAIARYNRQMRARQMDNAEAKADREWKRQLGIDAYTMKNKEDEAKRKEELHPFLLKKAESDALKAEYDKIIKKIEAGNAPTLAELEVLKLQRQIENINASTASHNRANRKEKPFEAIDRYGNTHKFEKYDDAVKFAIQEETFDTKDVVESTTKEEPILDRSGKEKGKKTTSTNKITKRYVPRKSKGQGYGGNGKGSGYGK